ncbi:nucleotide pyrophosphohydrolase [Atopobiaceae bacterium 24-176]
MAEEVRTTLDDQVVAVRAFRDERDWARFHTPKDLACAISVEAAELLDAFRWSGSDTGVDGREDAVCEELADVLIYCLYLADAIGADPAALIAQKLAANEAHYPADKARGNARKYTEL